MSKYQIKSIMRGYRVLKNNNKLYLLNDLKRILANIKEIRNIDGFGYIFQTISIKQYIFQKIIYATAFNRAILYSFGSGDGLLFPIPSLWQNKIIEYGVSVNKIGSSILWGYLVVKYWMRGVYVYLREIKKNTLSKKDLYSKSGYSSFYGLSKNNFPVKDAHESYDTISWYLKYNKNTAVKTILHNIHDISDYISNGVNIVYCKDEIPKIRSRYLAIKFIFIGLFFIVSAFIKMLVGKWQVSLMLGEIIKALQMQYVDETDLAEEYLFSNSEWIYRPLWTHVAEERGAKVQFYFYSTNTEPFKNKDGYPLQTNNWDLLTWSNYLVWDRYQRDFIGREVKYKSKIEIVGPIWGADCDKNIDDNIAGRVAVFDVSPRRNSIYQYLALQNEYYVPDVVCRFINDISEAIKHSSNSMVLKQKRESGDLHKQYVNQINQLNDDNKIILVDPCISAIRLIDVCQAVISLPFTSTAVLGKEAGKPSVYYDPTQRVQKDDRAAHGITVISGKSELQQWISKTILLVSPEE